MVNYIKGYTITRKIDNKRRNDYDKRSRIKNKASKANFLTENGKAVVVGD